MAKFKVNTYYEYVAVVEVEAETAEDAAQKGYDIALGMKADELDFVGYTGLEVKDENNALVWEEN